MASVEHLVVNGCSYMEAYADGLGPLDLANRLGIPTADTLALGGSANTRIIRTTLKHSYQTDRPTLYVLGMAFLSRLEIPILENQTEFEGRWTNPQNQKFVEHWQHGWTEVENEQFVDIKLKTEVFSILDRTEDLMYKIVSMISDLKQRGHRVLVYQQADDLYQQYLDNPRLKLFKSTPEIVNGYEWRAIVWQHNNGVPKKPRVANNPYYDQPEEIRHAHPDHYHKLNEFLVDYIRTNSIL